MRMERISLAHGDGGQLSHELINEIFVEGFKHYEYVRCDSALLSLTHSRIAVSTDSFVVKPLFFPGGDIGKLSVAGTINDLAVSGAEPKFLTAGFIIEGGFPIADLKSIVRSMAMEAEKAGVKVIAGDTKVVEHGSCDGLFINTTGIGVVGKYNPLNPNRMTEGDAIIVSGTIGDHGIAILTAQNELGLITDITSDCASLNHMIAELLHETEGIRIMRDPTRGGLATTLVELCEDFTVTMEIDEMALPIASGVKGVSTGLIPRSCRL